MYIYIDHVYTLLLHLPTFGLCLSFFSTLLPFHTLESQKQRVQYIKNTSTIILHIVKNVRSKKIVSFSSTFPKFIKKFDISQGKRAIFLSS